MFFVANVNSRQRLATMSWAVGRAVDMCHSSWRGEAKGPVLEKACQGTSRVTLILIEKLEPPMLASRTSKIGSLLLPLHLLQPPPDHKQLDRVMDPQKKSRRVTQLRGDTARPLLLADEKASGYDIPFPEYPPRTLQKRPLPANPSQLSFEPKLPVEQPAKRVKALTGDTSHAVYHKFMTLDQAGPATIASDSARTCSLVAIKRSRVKSNDKLPPIKGLPGTNVVNLIDMFRENGEIYMVYEQMDVSLRGVNGIAQGWNSHEIAAICREVGWR